MTTEQRVMRLFEQADPVPHPDAVAPPTSASTYLAILEQKGSTVTLSSTDSDTPETSPRRVWMLAGAAALAIVATVGALVVASRSDGPAPVDRPATTSDAPTTNPIPESTIPETSAPETSAPETTQAPATTQALVDTTARAFEVPTGVPDFSESIDGPDGLPVFFSAKGSGDALVDLGRVISSPHLIQAMNFTGTSDAYSVRALGPDQQEVELIVGPDGARSGDYLINVDQEEIAYFAVLADGGWNLNLYEPRNNFNVWDGAEIYNNAGPDVVTYTGDAVTVSFSSARDTPITIRTFTDEGGVELQLEAQGPIDGMIELPAGPVAIVIEADGNWSIELAGA